MPLYDYCCPQGHLFEQMATIAERERQNCPACGLLSEKIPSRISLAGRADPGPSMEQMPQTWRGTYEGNPEYLGQLRRQWGARKKLEDKYPELRGDQRPVLAGLIERHRGQAPRHVPSLSPTHTAFLTYTSGTTGPPKGAMNTHGNVVFNSQAYRQWCRLGLRSAEGMRAPALIISTGR